MLSSGLLVGVAPGGGGETQTAYNNFPEIPSTWYATGCCEGAIIADDIQVDPGTEGMQLAEITMRLYISNVATDFTLHIFHHDEDTGLPGELLGSKYLGFFPPVDYTVTTVNVWDMNISIPASGRLWIAVYSPTGLAGWNIADAEPTVGTTGNFYARDGGEGFDFSFPFDPIEFINLMLRVEVATDPCPADTNGDFVVNVDDLLQVIFDWGCTDPPGPCAGDVNTDGIVNVDDLVEVTLAWGPCFDV
jgi:hypothetical protein